MEKSSAIHNKKNFDIHNKKGFVIHNGKKGSPLWKTNLFFIMNRETFEILINKPILIS